MKYYKGNIMNTILKINSQAPNLLEKFLEENGKTIESIRKSDKLVTNPMAKKSNLTKQD